MYSRTSDGSGDTAPTTFGVSGKLWNGVLVMYDRATESLWTQIDGRALEGPRAGERLEHRPSTHTTWAAWRAAHPDTLVLEKPEDVRGFEHSRYAEYLADPDELWRPELAEDLGGIGPKDVVFGVSVGDERAAVAERLLVARGVVSTVVGGRPVAWVRDRSSGGVTAYSRRIGERVVVPARDGRGGWQDERTGEPLALDDLARLRVDRAFWYAWKRTHPDSTVITD